MWQAKMDNSIGEEFYEEEDGGEDSGEDEEEDAGFDYPFEDSDEWHDLHGFNTLVIEARKVENDEEPQKEK